MQFIEGAMSCVVNIFTAPPALKSHRRICLSSLAEKNRCSDTSVRLASRKCSRQVIESLWLFLSVSTTARSTSASFSIK